LLFKPGMYMQSREGKLPGSSLNLEITSHIRRNVGGKHAAGTFLTMDIAL
jgi:hypothetical protein